MVGNENPRPVVKNKVAPFKQAEFQIFYGAGISQEGELVDLGVKHKLIDKAGLVQLQRREDRPGQNQRDEALLRKQGTGCRGGSEAARAAALRHPFMDKAAPVAEYAEFEAENNGRFRIRMRKAGLIPGSLCYMVDESVNRPGSPLRRAGGHRPAPLPCVVLPPRRAESELADACVRRGFEEEVVTATRPLPWGMAGQ